MLHALYHGLRTVYIPNFFGSDDLHCTKRCKNVKHTKKRRKKNSTRHQVLVSLFERSITNVVQPVQVYVRVVPSSDGEAESSKQLTRRSAPALLHSSAGRISVKEQIPACSPGENCKMEQPAGTLVSYGRTSKQVQWRSSDLCASNAATTLGE